MIDPDTIARAICAEQCAFYGEPPCYALGAGQDWPNDECDEPGCHALAAAVLAAINAQDTP